MAVPLESRVLFVGYFSFGMGLGLFSLNFPYLVSVSHYLLCLAAYSRAFKLSLFVSQIDPLPDRRIQFFCEKSRCPATSKEKSFLPYIVFGTLLFFLWHLARYLHLHHEIFNLVVSCAGNHVNVALCRSLTWPLLSIVGDSFLLPRFAAPAAGDRAPAHGMQVFFQNIAQVRVRQDQ